MEKSKHKKKIGKLLVCLKGLSAIGCSSKKLKCCEVLDDFFRFAYVSVKML